MFFGQRNSFIKGIIWAVAILFGVTIFASFSGFLRSRKIKEEREEMERKRLQMEAEKYNIPEKDGNVVLAKYGEDNITVADFFDYFKKLNMNPSVSNNYKTVEQRETVLDYIVEKEIVRNYAISNNITVTDEDRINVLFKHMGDRLKGYTPEKVKELMNQGMFDKAELDYAVYEEKVKKDISEKSSNVNDLKQYYEDHKWRYQKDKEYQIAHILIKPDNKKRLEKIENEIKEDPDKLLRYYQNNRRNYLGKPQMKAKGLFISYKQEFNKTDLSDEEAQDFYSNNLSQYKEKEQVKASHILVKTEKNANDIRTRIKKGEDFTKLASKYSEDTSNKDKGGDLGWFGRGTMVPEFDKKVFSMKKGEISTPVKTQFGYHIIKLIDKKEEKQNTFKEVKDKVITAAKEQKVWNNLKKKVEAVKEEIDSRVYFNDLIKKYSDSKTASNYGNYGWIERDKKVKDPEYKELYDANGNLYSQLNRTIFDLNLAETSAEIKTESGYFFIKKMDEKKAQPQPFEVVKNKVKSDYINWQKDILANAQARDILNKLDNGEDFTKLAKDYSDGKTASEGGVLPWFNLGFLAEEDEELKNVLTDEIASQTYSFEGGQFKVGVAVVNEISTEIKKLRKDSISRVIKNANGYSIVKLLDERDGKIPSYEVVQEEVIQDTDFKVSDSEIEEYYNRNIAKYTEPEKVKVAYILVDDEEKANELYSKIQSGEDFSELAKEHSIDYTKDNGGLVEDYISKGTRTEEFDNVAFNMEIGKVSNPVKTDYGFQIIKLIDKKDEKVISLEDKKEEIRDILLDPQRNALFAKWKQEQKNKFGIKKYYNNFDYLVKYYE